MVMAAGHRGSSALDDLLLWQWVNELLRGSDRAL